MIYFSICEIPYVSHCFSRGDGCISTQKNLLRLYDNKNGLVQKSTLCLRTYNFIRPLNCLVLFSDLLLREEWRHGWAVRFLIACNMFSFFNISPYHLNFGRVLRKFLTLDYSYGFPRNYRLQNIPQKDPSTSIWYIISRKMTLLIWTLGVSIHICTR